MCYFPGVFMSSSNSLSANDVTITSSKDDSAHKPGAMDLCDTDKIIGWLSTFFILYLRKQRIRIN